MSKELLSIIDKRLKALLREFEEKVSNNIRKEWTAFTPSPNCPNNAMVITKIKDICHEAYAERARIAEETIKSIALDHKKIVKAKLVNRIMGIVEVYFSQEPFVHLAGQTDEVYKRAQSPHARFDHTALDQNMALIECSCKNLSRRAISNIRLMLEEIELSRKTEAGTFVSNITNFIMGPALKWVFGIVAALIAIATKIWLTKQS